MAVLLLLTLVPLLAALGLGLLTGRGVRRFGVLIVLGLAGFGLMVVLTGLYGTDPDTCRECTITVAGLEVRYATAAGLIALVSWMAGLAIAFAAAALLGRGAQAGTPGRPTASRSA